MIATIHSKQLIVLALCLCVAGCKSRPTFPIFPIFGERIDNCSDCQLSSSSESVAGDLVRVDSEARTDTKPTGILVNAKNALSPKKTPTAASSVNRDEPTEVVSGISGKTAGQAQTTAQTTSQRTSQGNLKTGKYHETRESGVKKDPSLSTIGKEDEPSQKSQPEKTIRRKNPTEKKISGEISSSKLTSIEKFDLGGKVDKLKSHDEEPGKPEMVRDHLATTPTKSDENETTPSEPSKTDEAGNPAAELPNLSDQFGSSNSLPSTTTENALQPPTQNIPSATRPLEVYVTRNPTQAWEGLQNHGSATPPKNLPDGFRVVNSPNEATSSTRQDRNSDSNPYFNNQPAKLESTNQDQPLVLDMRVKDWPTEPKMEPRAFQIQHELKTHRQITGNVAPGIDQQQFFNGDLPNHPPAQSTGPMRNANYRKGFSNHFDSSQIREERSNWAGSSDQEKESSLILSAVPKSQSVSLAPIVEVTAAQARSAHPDTTAPGTWDPDINHKNTLPNPPDRSPFPLLDEDGPIRDLPPINSENRYTDRSEERERPQIDR